MTWRFVAAKTQGTSHLRHELPCQDAFECAVLSSASGPVLVVVVSDGAGSASEGGVGAQHICSDLVRTIGECVGELGADSIQEWLKKAIDGVRTRLLDEAERRELAPRQMAATLLCAVLADEWSAFAQVGDGAIVTSEPGTGDWSWLFWPHRGEYANTTTFLTDVSALDALEVAVTPHGQQEVALFTDGIQHLVLNYAEQSVHSVFFEKMIRPVRLSQATGEDGALSDKLREYLQSDAVTARADDDLTLVLATRLHGVDDSEPSA